MEGVGSRGGEDEGKGEEATHRPGQAADAGGSEATHRPGLAADATVAKLFGEGLQHK